MLCMIYARNAAVAAQEEDTGTVLLPDDWELRCLPPPTLYIIIEKVWPDLTPDELEDKEYVGETVMLVKNVPPEVSERALRTWLNTGLDEHTEGLHDALVALKELETELNSLEDTVERFARDGMGMKDTTEDALKAQKERAVRVDFAHLEALAKYVKVEAEKNEIVKNCASNIPDLFTLTLDAGNEVMRVNNWVVEFSSTVQAQKFAYFATHKYDWSNVRLAVEKSTGGL